MANFRWGIGAVVLLVFVIAMALATGGELCKQWEGGTPTVFLIQQSYVIIKFRR